MSLVGLLDSTHQTFEGWTMDNISATLPMVSMTAAEAEIKKHIIENQELQSCCCPPKVGRDADILLGELYQRIFYNTYPFIGRFNGRKVFEYVSTDDVTVGDEKEIQEVLMCYS